MPSKKAKAPPSVPRAGDAPYSLTAVAFLAGAAAAALAGALPFLRTTHSAPPPAAPPLPRPTVAAEVLAHAALIAAERAREGRAGPHDCLLPPSHAPPSREFALPLSDAFGATLNLEALVRPWAPGAAPEQRYGPPPGVVELEALPSPEAFVRDFVGPGLPFVVRRYAQEHAHWAAMDLWRDDAHLAALVGDIPVDVRRSKHRDAFFHYAHSLSAHARLTMREFLASLSDPAAEQYYLGGCGEAARRGGGNRLRCRLIAFYKPVFKKIFATASHSAARFARSPPPPPPPPSPASPSSCRLRPASAPTSAPPSAPSRPRAAARHCAAAPCAATSSSAPVQCASTSAR